ncbi:MAG: hypothetical protein RLO50_11050 [Azospirillaceae bacterium]
MQHRLRTRFSGMDPSPGMQALVSLRMRELESMDTRVTACAIEIRADSLDQPARRMHSAWIAIDLACPPVASSWRLQVSARHENPYRAIIDCFRFARDRVARLTSSAPAARTLTGRTAVRRALPAERGNRVQPPAPPAVAQGPSSRLEPGQSGPRRRAGTPA